MQGLMQDWPLLIHKIIDHAALIHGKREFVTRSVEGPIHRTTYGALRQRSLAVAKRLAQSGIGHGDRIGTLAWNTWRHFEIWYGITGIGAICHTVNPRLFPEQIAWIINHAEDRILMVDLTFVPILERLAAQLPSVERYVVLTDAAHMPQTGLRGAIDYETWIGETDSDFAWMPVEENTAAGLCYTSGTTGSPKGVLYSHRSNVLHALQLCAADAMGPRSRDAFMPVVPMFHANAWATAFALPMTGVKTVMPGPALDGASLFDLMEQEGVTKTAGVPTIWMMLLQTMRDRGRAPRDLRWVGVGGSACPQALIAAFEGFGIEMWHAWGMTETSPVATWGQVRAEHAHLEGDALYAQKARQGSAPFGVEMIITDDDGRELPWDGSSFGRLKVRGPCISSAYYGDSTPVLDARGYFDTGDIATIDPIGIMTITDRAKDVIKSGGEWISSIELENLAVAHPDVAEAAVIGVEHPKWSERPLLIVVPAPGRTPDRADVLASFVGRTAKWWIPDDMRIIDRIPHTATGKIDKIGLRAFFRDYAWPTAGDG